MPEQSGEGRGVQGCSPGGGFGEKTTQTYKHSKINIISRLGNNELNPGLNFLAISLKLARRQFSDVIALLFFFLHFMNFSYAAS